MDKNQIIAAIRSAFPAGSPPGPDQIVASSYGECVEIKQAFLGKVWSEVPKVDLAYHHSAVAYFTETAFHYYLPAFLILLLEDIDTADVLATSVVRHLTLPTEVDTARLMHFTRLSGNTNQGIGQFLLDELKASTRNVHLFIARMSRFSKEQGSCIHSCLQVLNESYPDVYDEGEPLVAVQRYWFQFPALVE